MTDKIFARKIAGSALILVVVLTSLLAIVGVMFVMVARVDRIATSAISENKTLDYAVEAVIARISQELVLDVPGVAGREYYDYPGRRDRWLASLEPHKDGGYKWRQISDVAGYINREWGPAAQRNVDMDIVEDHKKIVLDEDGNIEGPGGQLADADGDGVADSKWIELEAINSSKGKTIYAAIRVIDNGAMLNVNTAYKFDPTENQERIDGSSQTQINLFALSERSVSNTITDLDNMRRGSETWDLDDYIEDVVWRYYQPAKGTKYTPFDISDELELRNRYTLNRSDVDSRIEQVWNSAFHGDNYLRVPVGSSSSSTLNSWEDEVYYEASDVNDVNTYSYRHIGTTYNMDRIINPVGVVLNNGKMVNVNRNRGGDVSLIYSAIKLALFTADPNFKDIDEIAAQIAINLVAFHNGAGDPNVPAAPGGDGTIYYGFARPCIYISEVVHKFVIPPAPGGPIGPGGEPVIYRSYAIELYKPYSEDSDPDNWRLVISGPPAPGGPIGAPIGAPIKGECDIDWSSGEQFHVMLKEDSGAPLPPIDDSNAGVQDCGELVFSDDDLIELRRCVDEVSDIWVTVDSIEVTGWLVPDSPVLGGTHSFERDINRHKCIRRLWGSDDDEKNLTLGYHNNYTNPSDGMIQAHPAYRDFTNVGEIGMVFRKGAYYIDPADRPDTIGYSANTDDEAEVRVNLADPNYRNLFQYLTVFDPTIDGIDNDGDGHGEVGFHPDEIKIPGRININTAPWYVIAQLPWMTDKIAQAIVAYRDKAVIPDQNNINYSDRYAATDINGLREEPGFASIGELATVVNDKNEDDYSMRYYALDSSDLTGFPDLTPGSNTADGAKDDFEERDVIFARISNLVTVRSDVFTAYILVRIGADGPQKRVMAILDRSNVYTDDGRVQIVALHAVADPR